MIRKLQNIFEFYKSTLAVNLAISLLSFLFGGFSEFIFTFMTFGFVVSIAIQEVRRKEDYLFYFNNGLSKVQLWIFTLFLNGISVLLLSCVYVFILKTR